MSGANETLPRMERQAAALGHDLGRWEHYIGHSQAACVACGQEVIVRWALGTEGARAVLGDALDNACRRVA